MAEEKNKEKEAGIAEEAEKKTAEKEVIIEEQEIYVYKQVKNILFGMLSPKMIKKMASVKIVTPELYDKEGYPVDGGLMDIRLGVIDPGLRCKTCGSKLKECTGHFGYIELARPVIHIEFVNYITDILRGTCRECGRIMLPKAKIEKALAEIEKIEKEKGTYEAKALIKSIVTYVKNVKKCPHCNAKWKKIIVEKPTTFLEEEKRLSPIEVRTRLEKIPDEDIRLFGLKPEFARPEWMVLTVLSIPPVTMRPSITLESGERSEDDLTHKLGDIVRINQRLFENINAGAPEIIIEDLWDLLQYHITTFFDNDVAQLPPARHRSGQPLKTISERIKSKEGRIRHNLAGKRTNFSSRTVISPDPMLDLNEVGIPLIVAMKLTVPETLRDWNKEYVVKFVQNGPNKYPGANYIVRPDGKKKKITDETREQLVEELQPGYIVERHLMDGDVAIFNRQPSLHRMSMMCHKVKVLSGRTFRLNPAVCAPYNADFDGDEMNLHVPQTEEARAEAEILMQVQTQLISPRNGLSIISCIQDAIVGNYLLTREFKLKRNEAVNLLSNAGVFDFSRLADKNEVDGKEIFSVLLPHNFDYVGRSKAADVDGNKDILIRKGKLIKGVMDGANLGEGSGLLLRNLHKQYGADYALELLGKMFRLGIEVLLSYGFSTAISDTDLPEEAKKKIRETLASSEEEVQNLIQLYHEQKLETFPGKTMLETLELKILELLNRTRSAAGTIVSEFIDKKAHTSIMAASGARGNIINMAQMAAIVGQQAMRGRRIGKGYIGRTLSCFKRDDYGPAARGFIKNSFKSGLSPSEFFFGAMTGRDSLMDTALRTPKSGYLYRRLANAMQDLKAEYDGTVRDAGGKIIQFSYGEDNVDVAKSEKGIINVKKIIELMGE
ncbi:DNA-directed RNA polymerase subunit A' [Candidatus Woesearchaeota archaeon]|nr:DNA-directed RNA polymerase subunit A' [Candidatus Woesearchaeota archaeon]